MFEFLAAADAERAVNVANHTIRLLERRASLPDDPGDAGIDVLGELSGTERLLALKALGEIQRAEKAPLASLPQSAADRYVGELSRVVRESTDKTLSASDLERGRDILASWKGQSHEGEPEYHIAVVAGGIIVMEVTEEEARSARSERRRHSERGESFARLYQMSDEELRQEAARLKESLFRLNFKMALGEPGVIKTVRREKKTLSRIQTIMRARAVSERPR